ncbi:hypothetical protein HMI54_008928 [Coelomomyces lativittatus]|nr:hypothetical protein HMI56_004195 [Coelomomyces lativittatus]KAJ1502547.1 hypothetical protein HMI54_008928 [Coelomomyces lativittatus]
MFSTSNPSSSALSQAQYFSNQFSKSWLALNQSLKQHLDSPSSSSLHELQLESFRLQQKLNEAALYLPSYDVEKYTLLLRQFELKLQSSQNLGTPKFSFRQRSKPTTLSSSSQSTIQPPSPLTPSKTNETIQEDHTHLCLYVPSLPLLQLTHFNHSVVICPSEIHGSVFLSHFQDCVVLLQHCQQVRMHSSTSVILCYSVSSEPILEDCDSIQVAPYPNSNLKANKFDQIQDFQWLFSEPNPHWSVLSSEAQSSLYQAILPLLERNPTESFPKVLTNTLLQTQFLASPKPLTVQNYSST